jgi:hypothetical protein
MEKTLKKIDRFASIDVLRGFALFMNVFVHLFLDVFNLSPITDNLAGLPVSILLLFVALGYFGSYGSFFILISGVGNMISMQKGYEKSQNPSKIVLRQIVSGFILLVFSMAVEGIFQFYGFFGTFFAMNSHEFDPTRSIWHAYSITPVTCLAMTMIITGIIEYFLSLKQGYRRQIRNIIIYIILSVIVLFVSQPVWDFCKAIGPAGFPNAHIGTIYPGNYPGDYRVYMPPPNATFGDYFKFFFLAMCAGSNHPIFPYLIMGFVGNIIGILMIRAQNPTTFDGHMPKKGMLAGIGVFFIGVIAIPILGVDFGSVLPVSSVGDITGINNGLNAFWVPWWCFLLAGEIFLIFLIIRLVEYRGIGKNVAAKTTFIRRFGMPAFSVYAWHRFWSIPVVVIMSWLAGVPSWVSGSITETSMNWAWSFVTCGLIWLWCGLILMVWEKVGYIGGIEWMMATVAALLGPNFRKTKGTQKENARWWEHGKMDIAPLFYHPNWIDIIPADEKYHAEQMDSKLAHKLSLIGFFCGFFSLIALRIALSSSKTEGSNPINQKAKKLSLVGSAILLAVVIALSTITLAMFNISL